MLSCSSLMRRVLREYVGVHKWCIGTNRNILPTDAFGLQRNTEETENN